MNFCFGRPNAAACICGGKKEPNISGKVQFFQKEQGVLVTAEVTGLADGFHGFHIHTGTDCSGAQFEKSKGHFDPTGTMHPSHAGDLPPLLSCNGRAYLAVLTDRFRVCDVLGRTVIIHSRRDDFKTQPAGDAGEKIACGIIKNG